MNKFTHLSDFLGYLFDDERTVKKAQAITAGILQARSCRLSDIAREMAGKEAGSRVSTGDDVMNLKQVECLQQQLVDLELELMHTK